MLHHLQQALAHHVSDKAMEPFSVSQSRGFNMVKFTTHYFTSCRDNPHGVGIPFNHMVDPNHILGLKKNDTYFYCEDNKVLYYILNYNTKGQPLW